MINPVSSKLGITEVVLRDGNQSLLATRIKTEDLLPIANALDEIGYWSIESWGGATFDSCLRYLNENPWERLRLFKSRNAKNKATNVIERPKSFRLQALS